MANNNDKYKNHSREELIDELETLKKKKYGLVWDKKNSQEMLDAFVNWENVPENFTPKQFPVLKEVKNKEIENDKAKPVNLLIEGDNYHSLAVLNFTHQNAVDVIYIDPPYNTGNEDFIFNDKFVDKDDPWRHSKWLSFMDKRLRLAHHLLKKTGAIFISIDDNELAQLKLLCDEIFGENNLIGIVTVGKGTTTGQDAKNFGSSADYLLVYGMEKFQLGKIEMSEKDKKRFSRKDKRGSYSILQWRKTGNGDKRADRPNLYYPVVDPDGKEVYPIGPTGYESRWRGDLKNFKNLEKEKMVEWIKQNGEWKPYIKYYLEGRGKAPSNLWVDIEGNKKATIELKEFFGERVFSNPKPTDLIKRCITLSNVIDPLVLDFFAGSGTTAQAVLDLNNQDDEQRRFILCTNNENNICTKICYPRIEKILKGYKNPKGEKIAGLDENLKYFKTDFVGSDSTDKNKRDLVNKSAEMICIKEDIFDLVADGGLDYRIYQKGKKFLGVIFDLDAIADFKREAEKHKGNFVVYCFSYTEATPEKEFKGLQNKYVLKPIPAVILRIYLEIFKK